MANTVKIVLEAVTDSLERGITNARQALEKINFKSLANNSAIAFNEIGRGLGAIVGGATMAYSALDQISREYKNLGREDISRQWESAKSATEQAKRAFLEYKNEFLPGGSVDEFFSRAMMGWEAVANLTAYALGGLPGQKTEADNALMDKARMIDAAGGYDAYEKSVQAAKLAVDNFNGVLDQETGVNLAALDANRDAAKEIEYITRAQYEEGKALIELNERLAEEDRLNRAALASINSATAGYIAMGKAQAEAAKKSKELYEAQLAQRKITATYILAQQAAEAAKQTSLMKSLLNIAKQQAAAQKQIEKQLASELERLEADNQERIVDIDTNYNKRKEQIEKDYQKRKKELQKVDARAVEDAIRAGDALALARALEVDKEGLAQLEESHAEELAENEQARQDDLANQRDAYQRQLAEAEKAHARQESELRESLKDQLTEVVAGLTDIKTFEDASNAARLLGIQTYWNNVIATYEAGYQGLAGIIARYSSGFQTPQTSSYTSTATSTPAWGGGGTYRPSPQRVTVVLQGEEALKSLVRGVIVDGYHISGYQ